MALFQSNIFHSLADLLFLVHMLTLSLPLPFLLSAKAKQLQMGHMVLINSPSSLCQCGAAGSESAVRSQRHMCRAAHGSQESAGGSLILGHP